MDETAAHALLGVIDPVRHGAFLDRYVGLPLDLTGVLFVAAAPSRVAFRRCWPSGSNCCR